MAKPQSTPLSNKKRTEIIQRQECRCFWCKGKGDTRFGPDGMWWQFDHVIPASHERFAGDNRRDIRSVSNRVAACAECNFAKRERPAWALIEALRKLRIPTSVIKGWLTHRSRSNRGFGISTDHAWVCHSKMGLFFAVSAEMQTRGLAATATTKGWEEQAARRNFLEPDGSAWLRRAS